MVAGELFLSLLATISDQNTLLVLEDGGLFLISPLGLWNNKGLYVNTVQHRNHVNSFSGLASYIMNNDFLLLRRKIALS